MNFAPLEWENLGGNTYRAPAPLFGSIRAEKWGAYWFVNWSVPGFSDSFTDGKFLNSDDARKAGEIEYQNRMAKFNTHKTEAE